MCGEDTASAAFLLTEPDGRPPVGSETFQGVIVEVLSDRLVIDRCHPATDCVPARVELRLGGGGAIPRGAFAEVRYERIPTAWIGFTYRISVVSIPDWNGTPNPAATGKRLFFAATAGSPEPPDGAPFRVEKTALNCPATPGVTSCRYATAYAFRFMAGMATAVVNMGATAKLKVDDYALNVTNGEAWDSKCTDDYWHWKWAAVYAP